MKKFIQTIVLLFVFTLLQSCIAINPHAGKKSKLVKPKFSTIEKEIFDFQNFARTNPKGVAKIIKDKLPYYKGKYLAMPGKIRIRLQEGKSAALEAIEFLNNIKPVSALKPSKGMSLAAKLHVRNEGPRGKIGHSGYNGSSTADRISKYGQWLHTAGENLAYGQKSAENIVISLIIDDGVSSRGHRDNIYNEDFKVTGVGFGMHKGYGTMTCLTYAGGYIDKLAGNNNDKSVTKYNFENLNFRPLNKKEKSLFHSAYLNYVLNRKSYLYMKSFVHLSTDQKINVYANVNKTIGKEIKIKFAPYLLLFIGLEKASEIGDNKNVFMYVILNFKNGKKEIYKINSAYFQKNANSANKLIAGLKKVIR